MTFMDTGDKDARFILGPFPFDEIRAEPNGDFFDSVADAMAAGFDLDQIWSVTCHDDDTFCHGPSHHYVNLLGFVATNERHDGHTYYVEGEDDK